MVFWTKALASATESTGARPRTPRPPDPRRRRRTVSGLAVHAVLVVVEGAVEAAVVEVGRDVVVGLPPTSAERPRWGTTGAPASPPAALLSLSPPSRTNRVPWFW